MKCVQLIAAQSKGVLEKIYHISIPSTYITPTQTVKRILSTLYTISKYIYTCNDDHTLCLLDGVVSGRRASHSLDYGTIVGDSGSGLEDFVLEQLRSVQHHDQQGSEID